MPGDNAASVRVARAIEALAQHACGRSALVAAGAEAALVAAAALRPGGWARALAAALEMLPPPEHGPGPFGARPGPQVCIACGALGSRARPLKQCSACRGPERWCSAECQRSSWAGHKAVCKERRAAASAAAAAGSE
jgi:hypothetical protein